MTRATGVPRGLKLAVAVVAALLLSGGLVLTGRADGTPTGKEVALGLEAECPERTETLYAADFQARRVFGRWVTVDGPTFGLRPGDPRPGLTAHAVDPDDPRRIYVSDGDSIQRSTDGGCNWYEVYARTGTGVPLVADVDDRIVQMTVSGRRVWALVAPPEDQAGALRVLVSDDGGTSWQDRSSGLPPAYTRADTEVLTCVPGPCGGTVLAVSPSDNNFAYLGLSRYGPEPALYATTDGGRSWQARPVYRPYLCCLTNFTELGVDPVDPLSVWAIETGRLSHSANGGTTWRIVDVGSGSFSRFGGLRLTTHEGKSQVQALRMNSSNNYANFSEVAVSDDVGASFELLTIAKPINGAAAVSQGGDPGALVMSTSRPDRTMFVELDPSGTSLRGASVWPLSDAGIGPVVAPQRDATAEAVHWFRGYAGLAVFVPGPLPPDRFPPDLGKLPFDPVAAARAGAGRVPGELFPAWLEADLGREGAAQVDYRLDLPALPTPVDIWFLVDTSGSMAGAIEGLQQGIETIIEELAASQIDAWYGVAAFPAQRLIYDRYVDLAPPNADLFAAIDRLDTDGQQNEIHPTALYQSVTGLGQEDAGLEAGRGASFRPQALKIIVHATDEAYGYDPGGPSEAEAAEAMAVAGVRHVGLDLAAGAIDPTGGVDTGGPRSTKRNHDAMARATQTFAPEGGVDCNGDGTNELKEGDPVTCPIQRGRDALDIAPAIIAAVRAIRDETEVGLRVVEAGGLNIDVADPVRSPVNVKVPNSLPFAVRFACPPAMTGQVAEVSLLATVRGAPSAEAKGRIGCGVPVPLAPPPPAPQPPAPLVPMVLAPPQLVPDIEPAVSPLNQTAPAQVGQPTPQAGLAAQPGQVEVAKQKAGRDGPPPPSPEAGDSRESSGAPAVAGTLGAGAAMAVALGGWAVRRERRVVTVTVRA